MVQVNILNDTLRTLKKGGIILFATDTIWGIGCDATDPEAVQKIFQLKKRHGSKPFVLIADSIEMVKDYVHDVHPKIETLLEFHTRPLTVIYEKNKNLPKEVIAADGSVAIRIVQPGFCNEIVKAFGKPLVATSANISDQPFPTSLGTISSDVIEGVDYVVSNQINLTNTPSVMVRVVGKDELDFIR